MSAEKTNLKYLFVINKLFHCVAVLIGFAIVLTKFVSFKIQIKSKWAKKVNTGKLYFKHDAKVWFSSSRKVGDKSFSLD